MDTLIRDVTLETVNQAIANTVGIKPGQHFSVVIVDESKPRPTFCDIANEMRATARDRGMTDELFDQIMNDLD